MNKWVMASMRRSAGKTSVIVGIAAALKKKMAYIKPFGERMLYRKKRLWDYDSALITNLFGLKEDPVDMSIGFDHSKLRYMYDQEGTQKGFDCDLVRSVSDAVRIPVIASGGMGGAPDLGKVVRDGHADAVAVASMLHYGKMTVPDLRAAAREQQIPVREP